jgi:hypothetical protein
MLLPKNRGLAPKVEKCVFPREKCDRYGFTPRKRPEFLLKPSQTMRIHAENTRIQSQTAHKPSIATGVNMEKQGVQPDIAVELTPKDWRKGIDTQLLKAVEVVATDVREWKVKKGSIAAGPSAPIPAATPSPRTPPSPSEAPIGADSAARLIRQVQPTPSGHGAPATAGSRAPSRCPLPDRSTRVEVAARCAGDEYRVRAAVAGTVRSPSRPETG